jgi:hypothetical protein
MLNMIGLGRALLLRTTRNRNVSDVFLPRAPVNHTIYDDPKVTAPASND